MPYSACTGRRADTTDLETCGTFAEAITALEKGGYAGLGYVFSQCDPFVGVDLDKCVTPETGAVAEWAGEWVDAFDSYTEISPSRTGLHIIIRGHIPGRKNQRAGVEAYPNTQGIPIYEPLDVYEWDLILPMALYITDPEEGVDWELAERFIRRTLNIPGNRKLAQLLRKYKLPPEQMPYFIEGLQVAMWGENGKGGINFRDKSGAFLEKRMRDEDALPILQKTVHEEALRLARRMVEDGQRFGYRNWADMSRTNRRRRARGEKPVSFPLVVSYRDDVRPREGISKKPSGHTVTEKLDEADETAATAEAGRVAEEMVDVNVDVILSKAQPYAEKEAGKKYLPTGGNWLSPGDPDYPKTVQKPDGTLGLEEPGKNTKVTHEQAALAEERRHWWNPQSGFVGFVGVGQSQDAFDLDFLKPGLEEVGKMLDRANLSKANGELKRPGEIAAMLADGCDKEEISERLEISASTYRSHLHKLRANGSLREDAAKFRRESKESDPARRTRLEERRLRRQMDRGEWAPDEESTKKQKVDYPWINPWLTVTKWEQKEARRRSITLEEWRKCNKRWVKRGKEWIKGDNERHVLWLERRKKEWAGRPPREAVVCFGNVFVVRETIKVRVIRKGASMSFSVRLYTKAMFGHWLCRHGYDPRTHHNHSSRAAFLRAITEFSEEIDDEEVDDEEIDEEEDAFGDFLKEISRKVDK